MKPGQVAMEAIIFIGIALVILIPLFFLTISGASETVKRQQANDAVTSLAQAANEVYALSPGTKKYVEINIPASVQDDQVQGNEIVLKTTNKGDFVGITNAVVVGNVPTEKGRYHVEVEHLQSGIVRIGTQADDLMPPVITYKSPNPPNGYMCNPIVLRVNTDESSLCKFDTVDTDYNSMSTFMNGNALGHHFDQGVQNQGIYIYYVRCKDTFGNMMTASELIAYTIDYARC